MFLVRTCSFLNNFSTKCETKLAQLNSRLESIDASLTLLETKLNSVDELKNLKLETTTTASSAPDPSAAQTQNTATLTAAGSSSAPPPPPPPPGAGAEQPAQAQPQVAVEAPPPPPPAEPVNTISQDSRYSKYFKMVKLGVAEEAVRIKMKTEGIDPSFLDRPNDPAPPPDDSESDDDDD